MSHALTASQDPRRALVRDRRRRRLGLAAFLAPIMAWLISLAASYVIQDFTCSAYTSAGRIPPGAAVFWLVVTLNAVMLVVCIAAVITGIALLARGNRKSVREEDASRGGFLGVSAIVAGLFFGYGVALIGAAPLLFGGCG